MRLGIMSCIPKRRWTNKAFDIYRSRASLKSQVAWMVCESCVCRAEQYFNWHRSATICISLLKWYKLNNFLLFTIKTDFKYIYFDNVECFNHDQVMHRCQFMINCHDIHKMILDLRNFWQPSLDFRSNDGRAERERAVWLCPQYNF